MDCPHCRHILRQVRHDISQFLGTSGRLLGKVSHSRTQLPLAFFETAEATPELLFQVLKALPDLPIPLLETGSGALHLTAVCLQRLGHMICECAALCLQRLAHLLRQRPQRRLADLHLLMLIRSRLFPILPCTALLLGHSWQLLPVACPQWRRRILAFLALVAIPSRRCVGLRLPCPCCVHGGSGTLSEGLHRLDACSEAGHGLVDEGGEL